MSFEPNIKIRRLSWSIIVAGIGATIVLISLAIPWYEVRDPDGWVDVKSTFLLSQLDCDRGTPWTWIIGLSLPVLGVIVSASITLLSVIYCLVKDKETASLWGWLGILNIGCLIASALYLLKFVHDEIGLLVNIVNYGIVVAFIGAVIMTLSHPYISKLFSLFLDTYRKTFSNS